MKKLNERAKEKVWVCHADRSDEATSAISAMADSLSIDPIIAALLYNRGYRDSREAAAFLKMENEMLRNPFDMADMSFAVERIRRAVENRERITVYGDYDVDGVTAVCTLYLYLEKQGAIVDYYIPNRAGEGYGVSRGAIDQIKEQGTTLIITVDTGITANDEVEYAKEIGVDVVVTDHHECRAELPRAAAVVNPHRPDCGYPFKELAGVGVVFKVICAYEERVNGRDRYSATLAVIKEFADLVAIGTIADVMPIKEENRIIVKYGLGMIQRTERIGLSALIEAASAKAEHRRGDRGAKKKKNKITSGYIGFTLAPRINAAGRIRSATMAVELFLSQDPVRAAEIAEELCIANRERQNEENKIMEEAYEKIRLLDINENPVIVLDADDWHHGVIGIVSSRITEKYCRPSILVSFEGNPKDTDRSEDIGKGSGRSIKGLNLVDALCYCSEHLVKFGGHELAAGLSVTRAELPAFIEKINMFARENLTEDALLPTVEADLEIPFSEISLPLAEALGQLEPYGVGNPIPTFIARSVTVMELTGVSDGKHSRIVLGDGRRVISSMYFSNSPDTLPVRVGDKADILFNIDINEWQERKSVQLILRDVKCSEEQRRIEDRERQRYEDIRNGATYSHGEDVLPTREDFVAVYRLVQASIHGGVDTLSHKDICARISSRSQSGRMNYIKLKFIIMIFKEMNVIGIEETDDEIYKFSIKYSATKYNLEKSSILRKLRTQLR